jgi:hypothetical protein
MLRVSNITSVVLPVLTCQSFGAVMEEFEVRDAIDNVFSGKDGGMMYE